MKHKINNTRKYPLGLFFSTLLLLSSTLSAQEIHELQQLLDPFSETKHLKLNYQEKRFSLFFKQAQQYHGYIEFISPDTYIKQIDSPKRKKIIIENDQLTLYQYNSDSILEEPVKKIMSLDDYPQFKQLKALFSGLFKGNASELTKFYRYQIKHSDNNETQLVLKSIIHDPFAEGKQFTNNTNKQIEIMFQNNFIKKITMTGLGGEKSELEFK